MNKFSQRNKKTIITKLNCLLLLFISVFVLGVVFNVVERPTRVLAEKGEQSQKPENNESSETVESPDPVEVSEPEETPEQEKVRERKAERVHNELEESIQRGNVDRVEIQPMSSTSGEGRVKLERTDGSSNEEVVPNSSASLISAQDGQGGTVSVSVGRNGTVTLVNGGVTVQTNFPVVIDPKTQTIAVRTPSGVTIINTLPSQALKGVAATDKPTAVQSAVLGEQDGRVYYDVRGTQLRRFLGIVPVSSHVETKINAQTGSTIATVKPWYLNLLGFLYTI